MDLVKFEQIHKEALVNTNQQIESEYGPFWRENSVACAAWLEMNDQYVNELLDNAVSK